MNKSGTPSKQLNYSKYLANRKKRHISKYKFRRRAQEALRVIRRFKPEGELSLLDIGAADGAMLDVLNSQLRLRTSLGIEPSLQLVAARGGPAIDLVVAAGEALPLARASFDVVIAASVIDHVKDAGRLLREVHRVLKSDGLLIVTVVDPFYDKLASRLKVKEDDHARSFDLRGLREFMLKHEFRVLESKKFALPSFGLIPAEGLIEGIFNKLGLGLFMFYSLVVGQPQSK